MNLLEYADAIEEQEQTRRDENKTGRAKVPRAPRLSIAEHFEAFIEQRPDVYDLLVRLARDVKRRGVSDYGMKAVFERARWHFRIEKGEADFKLNNNYTALFARRIMEREPDLAGFFKTRERRSH